MTKDDAKTVLSNLNKQLFECTSEKEEYRHAQTLDFEYHFGPLIWSIFYFAFHNPFDNEENTFSPDSSLGITCQKDEKLGNDEISIVYNTNEVVRFIVDINTYQIHTNPIIEQKK